MQRVAAVPKRMAQPFCWCIAMNLQAFLFDMQCVLVAGVCAALFCYFSHFYMPEILKAALVFFYEFRTPFPADQNHFKPEVLYGFSLWLLRARVP